MIEKRGDINNKIDDVITLDQKDLALLLSGKKLRCKLIMVTINMKNE